MGIFPLCHQSVHPVPFGLKLQTFSEFLFLSLETHLSVFPPLASLVARVFHARQQLLFPRFG